MHIVIHQLKLLALLPAEYIKSTYEEIKKRCRNDFGCYFDKYFEYYKKQWLKREGASQISVFKVRHRTDNIVESYHRKLSDQLTKRPHHNKFLGKYKNIK